VILTDLNEDGVTAAAKDLGVGENAIGQKMDVTQEQHWADVAKLAVEKFGRVDILVNNGEYFSYPWLLDWKHRY
jgi:NADP-dependent 3-hydroxy acid dehydrogenase YdfG